MRLLHFDPFSGASGDMLLAALVDCGAPAEDIAETLGSLGLGIEVSFGRTERGGLSALRARVSCPHDHEHRGLDDVLAIIRGAPLTESVRENASGAFRLLAEAEGKAHGIPPEEVHFHEVGALDSIADIVGVSRAVELLGAKLVSCGEVALGKGEIKCSHGVLPVPAPATVEILTGRPVRQLDLPFELCTPTGAALLSALSGRWGTMPSARIARVGYGAGSRELPGRPNVLRCILGEADAGGEELLLVETTIDDMQPELVGALYEKLASAGALEVTCTPVIAKKSRPAFRLSALCPRARLDALAQAIFRETTTFGLRVLPVERLALERRIERVSTPWGEVRVKLGLLDGKVVTRSPEYDDCVSLAENAGAAVKDVYLAATKASEKGL